MTSSKIFSETICERMSLRTCASVRPWSFSCFSNFFLSPPKYCFWICSSRASTCLSVISTSSACRLLLELLALDEELDRLVLQRLELLRARLRELALLVLVALLRLGEQRVVVALRDLLAVDDGDGVRGHLVVAAAAAGQSEADEGESEQRAYREKGERSS